MKKRIQINGQTYYIPCSADWHDPYRGETLRKEEVLEALKHLAARLGTRRLPWEVAEKIARMWSGSVGADDERISAWWKDNFPRETKPYIYCIPYCLFLTETQKWGM